jgi:hypothetical protein
MPEGQLQAAASEVVAACAPSTFVTLDVPGGASGTVSFWLSPDGSGSVWDAVQAVPLEGGSAAATAILSASTTRGFWVPSMGAARIRIKADTDLTNPVDVYLRGSSWQAVPSGGAGAAGENHLGEVGGNEVVVSAAFARPADVAAYASKDVVSNSTSAPIVLTFANLARVNAGSGYLVKARLESDQATNTARFRLHLYHTAPTPINDNAAFTILWANRAKRVGTIDFDALQTEGAGSDAAYSANKDVRLAFACDAASRTLYGVLETLDPFTPASGQNFFVELAADNN